MNVLSQRVNIYGGPGDEVCTAFGARPRRNGRKTVRDCDVAVSVDSGHEFSVGTHSSQPVGGPPGGTDVVMIEFEIIKEVPIDIKPGSYPNCFNINGNGVIPVAILGSADFDVTQIDVDTLEFAGLEVRVKGNGIPQCSVDDVSGDFTFPEGAPDGIDDLVCQFVDDPSLWNPGDGEATLTGELFDGTLIEGTDNICIVPAS
jgi:hypothetical protein